MDPGDVIQKNFVYLKSTLSVDPIRDLLFQGGVLTKDEYDLCSGNCGNFLDILMRKGRDGYKLFCAALEQSRQNHVKEQLDKTCSETGNISLVFVQKHEMQMTCQALEANLQARISQLEHEIEEKNKDISYINDENRKDMEELKTRYDAQLVNEKEKYQKHLEQIEDKLRILENEMSKAEGLLSTKVNQYDILEKKNSNLQKKFTELQEKYDALVPSTIPQREVLKNPPHPSGEESCAVCHRDLAEDDNLFVIPCLHKLCSECKEVQHLSTESQCSVCLSQFTPDKIKIDTARRNKISLNLRKSSMMCNYMISHNDQPAVCYCQNCGLGLCQNCQDVHGQTSYSLHHRTHDLEHLHQLPVQDVLKKSSCQVHQNMLLQLYDNDCKMNVCLICAQEAHKNHDMVNIDDAYSLARTEMDALSDNLRSKADEIQRFVNEEEEHEKVLDAKADSLVREISKLRETLTRRMLNRERLLHDDVMKSLATTHAATSERRNKLQEMATSLRRTMNFINSITEDCNKAEFLELKKLAEERSRDHLRWRVPTPDRRDSQIRLSLVGLNGLESQIDVFMSLYSVLDENTIDLPDNLPSTADLQEQIRSLEHSVHSLRLHLERTKIELKENLLLTKFERSKMELTIQNCESRLEKQKKNQVEEKQNLMDKLKVVKENLKEERENNVHLRRRCDDLQEKLHRESKIRKSSEKDSEKRISALREDSERMQERCKQLSQSLDQTVVCVGRHRGDSENYIVECPQLTFCLERLDGRVGRVSDENVFTNLPSQDESPRSSKTLMKYNGTLSAVPIFPAPFRFHQRPFYWEIEINAELIVELMPSNIVFETGVVEDNLVDRACLVFRENLAWCLVARYCTDHRSICIQIWENGKFVSCSRERMPNKTGEKITFRFGGVFDAKCGRLSFLDVATFVNVATFKIENVSPLYLTFGFHQRCENIKVDFQLISPKKLLMPAEKKRLILSALG